MKFTKLIVTATLIAATAIPVSANEWKQDSKGWWYKHSDGSYTRNAWESVNGVWYAFDSNGYMRTGWFQDGGKWYYLDASGVMKTGWLQDTGKWYYLNADGSMAVNTTVEGYRIGVDGVMIEETRNTMNVQYTDDSVTDSLSITDYYYESRFGLSYHILEITNNSPRTIEISINETGLNEKGDVIGASSTSVDDLPSGCTIFLKNIFLNVSGIKHFNTTIQTKEEKYYVPVLQNIEVSTSNLGDKVIVTAKNNGTLAAEFPEATAIFMKNGKVVDVSSTYLTDSDYELKPNASITEQIETYTDYDSVSVHLTARRSIWSD